MNISDRLFQRSCVEEVTEEFSMLNDFCSRVEEEVVFKDPSRISRISRPLDLQPILETEETSDSDDYDSGL
jgi:hypothetical protein